MEQYLNNSPLKSKQVDAANSMLAYLMDDPEMENVSMFLLLGYAGTGKTFTIGQVVKEFKDLTFGEVAMTAPTNKAVRVLKENAGKELEGLSFLTIHKLLGLKPVVQNDGVMKFLNDSWDTVSIENFKLLIVDEVSMLNDELFIDLVKACQKYHIKLIMLGDPAQIPPVRTTKDKSPELRDAMPLRSDIQKQYGIHVSTLTEIHRQKGKSAIIPFSMKVREQVLLPQLSLLPESKENGLHYVNQTDFDLIRDLLAKLFTGSEFELDSNYAKVIAWTNRVVDQFNGAIRRMKYGKEVGKICEGEELIADTVIMSIHDANIIDFNTNDEFKVVGYRIAEKKFHLCDKPLKFYLAIVEYYVADLDMLATKDIRILHEDSQEDFTNALNQLSEQAKSFQAMGRGTTYWKQYYAFKSLFAEVKYNYAITTHKCLPLCSKVLTFNGIKTIDKMKNDDNVITGNGSIQQVLDKFETGEKRVHVIKTRSGRVFRSSGEHRFLTEYGYQKASLIESGNHLALWRSSERSLFSFDIDYWMVGYLVGDGCYSYKSNRVDVTLDKRSNLVDVITLFFERKGNVKTYHKKAGNAITISVESKSFRDWLEQIGLNRVTGFKKSTPSFSSKAQKSNFIRGLFDADGSCSFEKRCIRFVSISRALIEEVSMLLQEFGIICSIRKNNVYSRSHSQSYTLSIYGESVLLYKDQIGFSSDYKMENLKKSCLIGDLGKTNIDFIPNSGIIIDYFVSLFSDNKTVGGMGNKGKGLYANKDRHVSHCLKYGRLSYSNLRILIDHCLQRNLYVPEWIVEILKNWYFYDEVVESFLSDEKCQMADIEVKQEHNFIYNGAIVHNSQGSGYENTVVIYNDIMSNSNVVERNRILYTASTRPKRNLYIIK